ncbi:MAG: peptidase M20, partial [Gammaproteobacteria bacterium]
MNARIPTSTLNPADALAQVSAQWDNDLVRQLTDYIQIPAKSPGFDPDWMQHGYIETVMCNAAAW